MRETCILLAGHSAARPPVRRPHFKIQALMEFGIPQEGRTGLHSEAAGMPPATSAANTDGRNTWLGKGGLDSIRLLVGMKKPANSSLWQVKMALKFGGAAYVALI